MSYPSRLVIDLSALRHNLNQVKKIAPASKIIAIVKTNAYGHGAISIAKGLPEVDAFGVSCLEEGEELISAGIRQPVILMQGFLSTDELSRIADAGLETVIHNDRQINMLVAAQPLVLQRVWLKVDTGLHRLGVSPSAFQTVWQILQKYRYKKPIALMTHLATASSESDSSMLNQQIEQFTSLTAHLDCEKSVANSAALIAYPQTHFDWVRPGIMLYGVSPFLGKTGIDLDLRPVMTLESQLISIRNLYAGEPVGYGANWYCPADMSVGIAAFGYGDGFPYQAKPGAKVLVNGQLARLIAKPFMDMLAIDLSGIRALVGDLVTFWGKDLPVEILARETQNIPYRLLCGLQHKRLQCIKHG